MIKIVWFIACMDEWKMVVLEELSALAKSGLLKAADEIFVCQAGNADLPLPDKCKIVKQSDINSFEFPALQLVKDIAQDGDKILYLHTKGVSRKGKAFLSGNHWRKYLLWGCVERWKEHARALDFCDISGVQITCLDANFANKCGSYRVFAGNFWWARGEWIKQLPIPSIQKNPKDRWKAEGWILSSGVPKITELHNITNGRMITVSYPFGDNFSTSMYRAGELNIMPRMVERRWEIINNLISHFGYKKYLEIGLFKGINFKHIVCEKKESVDPNAFWNATHKKTSDDFFAHTKREWDLIFIDGLHREEQVLIDIENALEHLSENGTIVVHDCNPETEDEQRDIADYDGRGIWVGTVWRGFAKLRMTRPDLYMAVIDADFGCGIIRRGSQKCFPKTDLSFPFFVQNRKNLMNIIEPEDFWQWLSDM